ncbi:hypothetical protein P280DRAFT_469620 [Massarina eburnea CBS 473.64]|uniref:Rhodopsin domain-containing protein n=1 Tax=Massarina eburnea CBS 473.64 TaxID=1395130 RepID=A0A6A6S0A5_9PLEO|nr:hypothetical protein P280DRAFT_469620 [Massarina eburnea CBS 473.64]
MAVMTWDPARFDVTPAMRPPGNLESDFSARNDVGIGMRMNAWLVPFVISSVLVVLRTYTRYFAMKSPGWDDHIMVFVWLFFAVYTILGFEAARHGNGTHQWNMSQTTLFDALHFSYIMTALYGPLIMVLKVSILLQLKRIFCPQNLGTISLIVRILIPLHIVVYTVGFITAMLLCIPMERYWHPYLAGKCSNKLVAFTIHAAFSVPSDLIILVIPLIKIWGLQHISGGRKLALTAIFATGLLACASGIMRLYYTTKLQNNNDYTYGMSRVSTWSVAEIASGIICACLPSVPPFVRHCIPRLRTLYGTVTPKRETSPDSFSGLGDSRDTIDSIVRLDAMGVKRDDRSLSSV